ncbi:MAG TPA: glucose-6-phosphate dehydrogenase, partial [Paraburkholderia sp.]
MTNKPANQAAPSASDQQPVDMIIFGGAGDLATRKLLPALYMAHLHANLPPDTRILGVGRRDWNLDEYRKFVDEQARPFIDEKALDNEAWQRFLDVFVYVRIDVNNADDYKRLVEAARQDALRVFYLSTSPDLFTSI